MQMATPVKELTIREFVSGDELAFRRLNEEWITRYFALEGKDDEALGEPRRFILDRGGKILLAVQDGEAVGCCALLPLGPCTGAPAEFEVAKMAVTASAQGGGIGRRLLVATIAVAQELGATRLYLETNRKLAPAIRLYESLGFQHLPPERIVPSAYARANVYMEKMMRG
jgi:putative acetyltransferase